MRWRRLALVTKVLLVVLLMAIITSTTYAAVTFIAQAGKPSNIIWPVNVTQGSWRIIQGYNGAGDHRGDQLYGLDLARKDNPDLTPGTAIVSPTNGYVAWIWAATENKGLCVIIAVDGYSQSNVDHYSTRRISICHVDSPIAKGTRVLEGRQIGKVSNWTGNQHLHISIYDLNPNMADTKSSRTPVPFTGNMRIRGCSDFNTDSKHEVDPITCSEYPSGWYTGPTPSDGSPLPVNGSTQQGNVIPINVQAMETTGVGVKQVDITVSSDNKSWHALPTPKRTDKGKIAEFYAEYRFLPGQQEEYIGFNVLSNSGLRNNSPRGIRRICVSSKKDCQPYNHSSNNGKPHGGGSGDNSTVVACSDTNYTGTCASFGIGTVNDLSNYGLSSSISSIIVPDSVTLFLSDQTNLGGQHGTFNQDVPDLSANGNWNDRAKSLKIEKKLDVSCTVANNVDGIILYHDVNYGTNGGCRLATDSINDLGTMDFTRISSLRFSGSFIGHKKVTLYKDANYGLVCGVYTTDKSDLRECAQQDIVSIKIEDYLQPQQANNIASSAILDPSNAGNAVDGDLNTYWVGGNKHALSLSFPSTQSIQKIVVYDLPQGNTTNHLDNNQINKVQIDFSDGTKTPEVDMESGGRRCAAISFSVKAAQKVIVQPTDASGNNGFREVFIYDTSESGTDNPCDNATNVTLLGTPVVQPEQNQPQPVQSGENPPNNNTSTQPTPTQTAIPTENATNYHPTQTEDVEAEKQELTEPAYIENCGGCSGGKFVFNVGSDGNGGQTLGTVKVSIAMKYAGDYQLTIYYCSAQDMDGQIAVANGTSYPIHYPSAGTVCWNGGSPAHISTTIHLNGQGDLITFSIPNPPTSGEVRFGIDTFTFVG